MREFPQAVRQTAGFAPRQAQLGGKHRGAKVLRGFGGAGMLEIVEDQDGETYRAVYCVSPLGG